MQLLVLNFFPAFTPACSGGELRLGRLYRALSRTHAITMLTSTDFAARHEEILHTANFRELRFPKDELWRNAYETLDAAGVIGELSGLAFALAVSDPACKLRQTARELAGTADAVIHEFPYSEPIFADLSIDHEIYNAHNFEASLLPNVVHGSGLDVALLKLMRLEGNLVHRARRIFAPSSADAEKFRLFYGVDAGKLSLCPNGFDEAELAPVLARRRKQRHSRPQILFTGSAHRPNLEAAQFVGELAGRLPECDVIIAGAVSQALSGQALPANLRLIASFTDQEKLDLFARADLFLNPVTQGSGTSLKVLEVLGAGVPLLTTPEGARGLDIVPGVHAEVVPRAAFADSIEALLAAPERRQSLSRSAHALARETYSWDAIAKKLGEDIEAFRSPAPQAATRPCLLALNDYPALTKESGGANRIRGLLENLDLDVVLVSFGDRFDVALPAPGFLHVLVERSASHRAFEDALNTGQISANDVAASLFAGSNRVLTHIVAEVARRAVLAVFEHCYMAPLLDNIRTVRPDIPIVYSAHNAEAVYKPGILQGHPQGTVLSQFIRTLEEQLVGRAALIVCCTDTDAGHFAQSDVETIVVPNGTWSPPGRPHDTHESANENLRANGVSANGLPVNGVRANGVPTNGKRVGFLGSSHGPNTEAAQFVVAELAPEFPEIRFELVGSICSALTGPVPSNVVLHGVVDDAAKTDILAGWSLALNPVQTGGGSSLKLPDYLAHRLPTINTATGARGLAIEERNAGRVVERSRFGEVLAELLADPAHLGILAENAHRYATEALSWWSVTAPYRQRVRELASHPEARRRSLLVVTNRYTEPPLGGAEEYLVQAVRGLRSRFDRVDLAAIDCRQIGDAHHFRCVVSSIGGGASTRTGELFDQALYFPPEPQSADVVLETCRALERAWSGEEAGLFAPFAGDFAASRRPFLFTGFFPPEQHRGQTQRWTSPSFSFLVTGESRLLRFHGWTPCPKTMELMLAQIAPDGTVRILARQRQAVTSHFAVNLDLPVIDQGDPLLVMCAVEEHDTHNDHRPFGVLLEGASVLLGKSPGSFAPLDEITLDLGEDKERLLSASHCERWIDALRRNALRRAAEADEQFSLARGPHCPALQEWLGHNASHYDAILVHALPFEIVPATVRTMRALPRPPRIVILPHFHGDDRFYYWRRYLESFEAADATLLFSDALAQRLGSGRFTVVPGGGVSAEELLDRTAADAFSLIHDTSVPFFLVLGRKTRSKGYEAIIRAYALLRAEDANPPELVLIGPDEDGLPIDADGVHYLGPQPRDVVRGALSQCLALVTMSESESFGIVLAEAWLFGKPVIANRFCHSFRELVRNEENGLLVSGETELRDAMRRFAEDESLREILGNAGFQEAIRKYTWAGVADAVAEALVPSVSEQMRSGLTKPADMSDKRLHGRPEKRTRRDTARRKTGTDVSNHRHEAH